MARKKSKTPTKIFSYGALAPSKDDDRSIHAVLRQAEALKRDLIRMFRDSRKEYAELQAFYSIEDSAELEDEKKGLREILASKRERKKKCRSHSRYLVKKGLAKRKEDTDAFKEEQVLAEEIKNDSRRLKEINAKLKEIRAACQHPEFKAKAKKLHKRRDKEVERLRQHHRQLGLFWGTSNGIIESVLAANRTPAGPQFRPFDGSGRLIFQCQRQNGIEDLKAIYEREKKEYQAQMALFLQGERKKEPKEPQVTKKVQNWEMRRKKYEEGMRLFEEGKRPKAPKLPSPPKTKKHDIASIFPDSDGHVKNNDVQVLPGRLTEKQQARGRSLDPTWRTLRMKIRANPGEEPYEKTHIEIPFTMHRPLPEDGELKYVWLLRRKVGSTFRYFVQFVVESASFAPPKRGEGHGAIGIDLGWSQAGDGLRCLYWMDSFGDHGEVNLGMFSRTRGRAQGRKRGRVTPVTYSLHERLLYLERLRAHRDANLETFKGALKAWMEEQTTLPEWLLEKKGGPLQKMKQRGLGKLFAHWRANRVPGDRFVFEQFEGWNKQDLHLRDILQNQEKRARGQRDEEIRTWAVKLAKRYATIYIEKMGHRGFKKKSDGDETVGVDRGGETRRKNHSMAAPGRRIHLLKEACKKYGARLVEVDPRYTSQDCPKCRGRLCYEKSGARTALCLPCQTSFDRDYVGAFNILARGQELETLPKPEEQEKAA